MTAADLSSGRRKLGGALQRIDPVLAAIAAVFLALALLAPAQAWDSAGFTAEALAEVAPFIALSVLLAGGLKAAGADTLIAAAVGRSPATMVALAAVAGAFSPFCSCGVVPIIAGLLAAGMPLAPVMAFWIASPLMDPQMFVLTAAGIGTDFALAKTAAAVGMGLFGGFLTLALTRGGRFASPLRVQAGGCGSGCGRPKAPTVSVEWVFWRDAARRRTFLTEAWANGLFLARWLALAFLVESLMVAWLPAELVARALSAENGLSVPLAVVVGVPAYLNGYAAIPLVGELIGMGMAPGAGLAFMLAGGVTSIPAAMAVLAIARREVFLLYLAIAFSGSLAAGYAFQSVS